MKKLILGFLICLSILLPNIAKCDYTVNPFLKHDNFVVCVEPKNDTCIHGSKRITLDELIRYNFNLKEYLIVGIEPESDKEKLVFIVYIKYK